jgi:hypothetical protein
MNINLTFGDIVKLGANGTLTKDGVTISCGPPVLRELTLGNPPEKEGGQVVFSLDTTDARSAHAFDS